MKIVEVHVPTAIAPPDLLSARCDALVRRVRKPRYTRYCQHQLEGGCVDIVVLVEGKVDHPAGRGCSLSTEDRLDTSVLMSVHLIAPHLSPLDPVFGIRGGSEQL